MIAGGVALVGGATAIYFATRKPTAAPPPNQQIGKGTNVPATKPAPPSYIASANMSEFGSFAAWLANNPPPPLNPDTGNY